MMPVRDEDRTHIGFVKIVRDRTAEHLAGKTLANTKRQPHLAQDAEGIGLFTVVIVRNHLRPTRSFVAFTG